MAYWTEVTYIESPDVIGESMRRGVDQADDDVTNLLALLDEHGVDQCDRSTSPAGSAAIHSNSPRPGSP